MTAVPPLNVVGRMGNHGRFSQAPYDCLRFARM